MATSTEKSRGRNNTPSQRRFPNLRGRSASRGRSATPTKASKEDSSSSNNSNNNSRNSTPSRRNFKFKKLLPHSKSRNKRQASPNTTTSTITKHSNQKEVEEVIVSPKQTRSVNDPPNPESSSERDAPENTSPSNDSSSSKNPHKRRQPKRIHNESERDGFCRRVDYYDGQTINVDGIPTYEVGNYLGGGVAGVVYEGTRLRPIEEYPIRTSFKELMNVNKFQARRTNSLLSNDSDGEDEDGRNHNANELLTDLVVNGNVAEQNMVGGCAGIFCGQSPSDLEGNNDLILDVETSNNYDRSMLSSPGSSDKISLQEMERLKEESVAIKILNPVGFRLLSPSACASAVVVQQGMDMEDDVKKGLKPMTEKHVWWLVNPSSKNLRTLQRNPSPIVGREGEKIGLNNDLYNRGSRDNGIRLSLVAAYIEPKSNALRELPLTRCIEVWGHAPFGTTEEEFESMMDAIERVNQGQPNDDYDGKLNLKDSGLFRAAISQKTTVHCKQLNAYITVPAVPPKYIRWLRQRRAATKEIRNMMRIGRHKNVVHLFEVMELIQDSKSTMFLVLELVKGGELFDLISTNSTGTKTSNHEISHLSENQQNEYIMRNFFKELASGVAYCHANGIAHRDLKPENLLVHNESNGNCTLKIADFGLSSTFALATTNVERPYSSQRGLTCGGGTVSTPNSKPPLSPSPVTGFSPLLTNKLTNALSFLTCGGMEQLTECFGSFSEDYTGTSKSLNRMTSIVGSPHYVAPEIICQPDDRKQTTADQRGYDGTKADVWSAGVILYAMLFRSLPFGEDLLRCPRYQSFTKWYKEARSTGRRRANAESALEPVNAVQDADDLGPHWFFPSKTSPESKDIIVAMLNPDPASRMDVKQVLLHPWMSLKM